jgi:hypothetical protein
MCNLAKSGVIAAEKVRRVDKEQDDIDRRQQDREY